ncbi:MAG: hypothetical protein WCD70_03880 [Alphaproteobacteria bacterium]
MTFILRAAKMIFAKDHISRESDKAVLLVQGELLLPRSTGPPKSI